MSTPLEVLAAEALNLPPEERSELLDRLPASLEPSPFDPAWKQAWAQEADRRETDIEAGCAKWIPGEDVVSRLRARIKCPSDEGVKIGAVAHQHRKPMYWKARA